MNSRSKMNSDVKMPWSGLPVLLAVLSCVFLPLSLHAQDAFFCNGAGGISPAVPVPQSVSSSPCCSSAVSTCDINYPNCACITAECNKPGSPSCCLTNSCGPDICDEPCTPPLVGTDITLCESGGGSPITLWPNDFRPASSIPLSRDTTQRVAGKGVPGAQSGFELFKSLDVVTVNGISRRLYVAYNAGIQVWNIENDPDLSSSNTAMDYRDGWMGHFNTFPPASEQLNFIEDIAGLNDGARDVIAVAGKFGVGVTIWTLNTSTGKFTQKYQDVGTEGLQTRMVEHNDRLYAFMAHGNGVEIYDATAAADLGSVCETNKDAGACPQVYLGSIAGINFSRYLDVLVASNKIYVATSPGLVFPVEIYQLNTANSWSSPLKVFNGTSPNLTAGRGPAMFETNGHFYLATLVDHKLKVALIDDCVDGGIGPCTPPLVVNATSNISPSPSIIGAQSEFLTFSEGSGTPFLYYGVALTNLDGSNLDQLLNLSTLPTSSVGSPLTSLPEVTASGSGYTDPCNGKQIRYWSHYYSLNTHGLRDMHPKIGRMGASGYFYRAAQTIVDVHKYGDETPNPIITVNTTSPASGPYWMNQPITVQATASSPSSCAGAWSWDIIGEGGDPSDIDDVAVVNFPICGSGGQCPATGHTIEATNGGCATATVIGKSITTQDPRPFINDVDILPASGTNTYDVGAQLTFDADVDGRDDGSVPMSHSWEVFKQGNATALLSSNADSFLLDTCNSLFSELVFEDGFESGNTTRWFNSSSKAADTLHLAVPSERRAVEKATDIFTVKLTSTNSQGSDTDQSTSFTLEGAGSLTLSNMTSNPTHQSNENGVTLSVDSNATEFRWEIEDAAGNCVDAGNCATVCDHYPAGCTVFDWGREGDQIDFVWQEPNVIGARRVTVEGRKCAEGPLSAETTVSVDLVPSTVVPVVLTFKIASSNLSGSIDPTKPCVVNTVAKTFKCRVGDEIEFEVVTDSDPVNDYSFDWLGNGNYGSFTTSTTRTYTLVNTTGFNPAVKARKGTGVSETGVVLKHLGQEFMVTIENF